MGGGRDFRIDMVELYYLRALLRTALPLKVVQSFSNQLWYTKYTLNVLYNIITINLLLIYNVSCILCAIIFLFMHAKGFFYP